MFRSVPSLVFNSSGNVQDVLPNLSAEKTISGKYPAKSYKEKSLSANVGYASPPNEFFGVE